MKMQIELLQAFRKDTFEFKFLIVMLHTAYNLITSNIFYPCDAKSFTPSFFKKTQT